MEENLFERAPKKENVLYYFLKRIKSPNPGLVPT